MFSESKAIERLEYLIDKIDNGDWFIINGVKCCFIGGLLYFDGGCGIRKTKISLNELLEVEIREINE
jgi:hypothetical protein